MAGRDPPVSTHSGSSKIEYSFLTIFPAMVSMTVLPICSSLEPGPINDCGPRGSDHHMVPEWKDLFSARRFSIAVGTSESDTEATVWQLATMVCDAGNRHPGPLRPVGPVYWPVTRVL